MDFDALYQHILNSEQAAQQLQERTYKVKENISKCQADTNAATAVVQQLQASVEYDELKLTEERSNVEVLRHQVQVLVERRHQLRQSVKEMQVKLQYKNEERDIKLDLFLSDIREFMRVYDLLPSGREERAKRREREVDDLKKLEEDTIKELELAQEDLKLLTKEQDEKTRLEVDIAYIQRNIIDLDEKIKTTGQKSNRLSCEIRNLGTDKEQETLKKELSETLNAASVANDHVAEMRKELEVLQHQHWEKGVENSAVKP